ncbi:MAG: class I SAM-dependent methyltransferase [Acidobacteriia bacterium]|nr:class I SAM-dependent methyltransferase [Terriglobia bacterium]
MKPSPETLSSSAERQAPLALMKNLVLFFFACTAVFPQAADYANSGYKTKEGRERVGQTLSAHDRETTQKPKDLVENLKLKAGMTVADIGTGVGYMLPFLHAAVGPAGKIVAEDIFPDFLARARENATAKGLDNVAFVQGTEKDPHLPAASIDLALVLDVYHHFDYPAEMLAGIAKGLKPDGRLAIVDFYQSGFRDPKHIRLDEPDVIKELEANGFQLISTGVFTPNRQYLALFRKK